MAGDISPYAEGAPPLRALGYHTIPIWPQEKRPAELRHGRVVNFIAWQLRRDTPADDQRFAQECSWPDINVGLVLGSPAGTRDGEPLHVIAIDIDAPDYDDVDTIQRAIPASPMAKTGAKGLTLFYRAARSVRSRAFKRGSTTLVDLLTGFEAKQSVMPPSVHPTGAIYRWIAGPVAPDQLPVFDQDAMTQLEEILLHLGWNAEAQAAGRPQRAPVDGGLDTVWADLNAEALARLSDWLPALGLYNLKRVGPQRWVCVATWRGSSTGRPNEQRKRNLSIHAEHGIKDFGDQRTYSAIDLVMAARSCAQEDAYAWLRALLGGADDGVVIALEPREARPLPPPPVPESATRAAPSLRPPGLVGDVMDWILATSRRPQPVLALGAALCAVGTAIGRQFAGPTMSGTHLYVLGIAPTGAGKDHPQARLAALLAAAGMPPGPSNFTSMPAVVRFLQRQPLACCVMDEFGSFMARVNAKRASGFEKQISATLRTAWGASFTSMTTPEYASAKSATIQWPALSIFGVSTAEEFFGSLDGLDASNGFLNRFLLLESTQRPIDRDPEADPLEMPQEIVGRLQALIGLGGSASHISERAPPQARRISWAGPDAADIYKAMCREIEAASDKEPETAAFLARAAETAVRIATIIAAGCEQDVTASHMRWARDLALWSFGGLMDRARDHMAETENQAMANRLRKVLRERGGWVSRRDLIYGMRHVMKKRDLDSLIDAMVEAGDIVKETGDTPPTGGPRPTLYALAR